MTVVHPPVIAVAHDVHPETVVRLPNGKPKTVGQMLGERIELEGQYKLDPKDRSYSNVSVDTPDAGKQIHHLITKVKKNDLVVFDGHVTHERHDADATLKTLKNHFNAHVLITRMPELVEAAARHGVIVPEIDGAKVMGAPSKLPVPRLNLAKVTPGKQHAMMLTPRGLEISGEHVDAGTSERAYTDKDENSLRMLGRFATKRNDVVAQSGSQHRPYRMTLLSTGDEAVHTAAATRAKQLGIGITDHIKAASQKAALRHITSQRPDVVYTTDEPFSHELRRNKVPVGIPTTTRLLPKEHAEEVAQQPARVLFDNDAVLVDSEMEVEVVHLDHPTAMKNQFARSEHPSNAGPMMQTFKSLQGVEETKAVTSRPGDQGTQRIKTTNSEHGVPDTRIVCVGDRSKSGETDDKNYVMAFDDSHGKIRQMGLRTPTARVPVLPEEKECPPELLAQKAALHKKLAGMSHRQATITARSLENAVANASVKMPIRKPFSNDSASELSIRSMTDDVLKSVPQAAGQPA